MIPIEIKTRIVFLLAVYLLEDIGLHLSSLLLPYYLDDEGQLTGWIIWPLSYLNKL